MSWRTPPASIRTEEGHAVRRGEGAGSGDVREGVDELLEGRQEKNDVELLPEAKPSEAAGNDLHAFWIDLHLDGRHSRCAALPGQGGEARRADDQNRASAEVGDGAEHALDSLSVELLPRR